MKQSTLNKIVEQSIRLEYQKYYKPFFSNCLKIRDKNSNIIAFNVNVEQEELIKIIEEWKEKYPDPAERPTLYIVIPKPRQVGYSTVTEAVFFHDLCFSENKVAMIISYDVDSATVINDMSNRFYQYLPQKFKPLRRKSLGKGILFENPNFDSAKEISPDNDPGLQSKFLIETANNVNAGSSYTINMLHISELAKWPNPEETLTSLLQSVPKTDAIVVVESTAKGLNYFYDLCSEARDGKNNYKLLFIPWFMHEEYQSPHESFELTEEEIRLQKTYDLTLDQLQWRRDTIKNKCQNKEDIFHQEYPAYLEEAFITTGKPVFDNNIVMERIKELEQLNVGERGNLVYNKDNKLEFKLNPNGLITIYEYPHPKKFYVGGFDVAEGKEDGDYDAGHIIDNVTLKQCAVFHGHIPVDLYAEEMYKLGEYYNWALLAPETNYNIGCVVNLERMQYPSLYIRQQEHVISKNITKEFGFNTNKVTRGPIISDLVEFVREHVNLINDIPTLKEMLTFVNIDSKPQGMPGKNDDLVMSKAITLHAALSGQQKRASMERETDWDKVDKLEDDAREDFYNMSPEDQKRKATEWGLWK